MKFCSRVLKATLVWAAMLASPWAQSAPADCRFVFEGTTYIDGACEFKASAGGSFRISANGYELDVSVDGTSAEGHWNGDVRSIRMQHPLHLDGVLKRQGACWESPAVQVCAWGGKRPGPAPAQALVRQEARAYPDAQDDMIGSWSLVRVQRAGQLQHCYGSVLSEGESSPMRLQLDRTGQWTLITPSAGKPRGFQGVIDAEFHKASGQLRARIDPTGQRMLMSLTADDVRMLEAGASLQLGYGKGLLYRFEQTREALAKLRQCAKG
jgi:hypothetical protein